MNSHVRVIPLTLKQANDLIVSWHRHHKPVQGHRFSLGALHDEDIVGAAVVGRPVARGTDPYRVSEVTRLVTNGFSNACSALYSACARTCREMGFWRIQTYILKTELGTSLVASGWCRIQSNGDPCACDVGCDKCITAGGDWNCKQRTGRRTDQPMEPKQRWGKKLNAHA